MSTRFATTIGVASEVGRPTGTGDVTRTREPTTGAQIRSKGSLYLLAQVSPPDRDAALAAADALAAIERDYFHDLSGGVPVALDRAVREANRRLYHQRQRLGIPGRTRIGIIALVIHGSEAHVAGIGSAAAVLARADRLYELAAPSGDPAAAPPARRRVAASAGEALEVEPRSWQGRIMGGDRLVLLSRRLGRAVGAEELKRAVSGLPPWRAVEHLGRVAAEGGGAATDGMVALEVSEVPITEAPHPLEPVHPAAPLAGLADESPIPLADGIAREARRGRAALDGLRRRAAATAGRMAAGTVALTPRRRPEYPRGIPRTDALRDVRRRTLGTVGMAAVAALVACGAVVAGLPAVPPTEAIPRTVAARDSISDALRLLSFARERVRGADLVDRDPEAAATVLLEARAALERAALAGVAERALVALHAQVDVSLDRLHRVTRLDVPEVVADLSASLEAFEPLDMVGASDGSLWVLETGRGRVVRVDPATGEAAVVYRAGQAVAGGLVPGDPWLIATAATDVVVIDRARAAWRIDLVERIPRQMTLAGIGRISAETTLVAALQHRPPLEIFTLYAVDPEKGEVERWTPPPVIPTEFPDPPERYLAEPADLHPGAARDVRVDTNGWLLHAGTVTRIDFGTPRAQDEYSLDPPPDASLRGVLDYRLLDGATVGDRELLYVHDAGSDRLLAFQRADGAFVRQWMAPTRGPARGTLADVRGLVVPSVADGPPVAFLLTAQGVVRLVLD